MQIPKWQIVDALRNANLTELADDVDRSWPEMIDVDRAAALLQRHGITKDMLISRMGGSP
jgi:hypothetical protein